MSILSRIVLPPQRVVPLARRPLIGDVSFYGRCQGNVNLPHPGWSTNCVMDSERNPIQ